MDRVAENLDRIDHTKQFTTNEFHGYLLGNKDSLSELLPSVVDLSAYIPRINEMYDTQIQRSMWRDYRVPLEQRLRDPKEISIAGERGCSSYYDPKTQTIKFTPIIHGKEGSVTREAFDLIRQQKLPILEIHTHPEDQLFSPRDYVTLLLKVGVGTRFMKAALLPCPSNQILALASSETAKYDQDELEKLLNEWDKQHNVELDQITQSSMDRERINSERFERAVERLKRLAASGKFTQSQVLKKGDDLLKQSQSSTFRNDAIDMGKIAQKQNQGLLGFALSNGIKLYFSTDRSIFKEFSA